jgi:hypothetical protein
LFVHPVEPVCALRVLCVHPVEPVCDAHAH